MRFLAGIIFSLDELRYDYPHELREGFASEQEALEAFTWAGAAERYPRAYRHRSTTRSATNCASSPQLNYAAYFLTVHDIVRYARSTAHSLPGPRLGGEFHHLLLPGHHRGRSDAARSSVRTVHFGRAQRAARHRRRFRARAARRGDAIYLSTITGATTPASRRASSPIGRVRRSATSAKSSAFRKIPSRLCRARPGAGSPAPIDAEATRRIGFDPHEPRLALAHRDRRRALRLSAPSVAAYRRFRHHPHAARRSDADRQCGHGRTHDDRMGQGRSRCARHPEDRRSRARHALLPAPRFRSPRKALRRRR